MSYSRLVATAGISIFAGPNQFNKSALGSSAWTWNRSTPIPATEAVDEILEDLIRKAKTIPVDQDRLEQISAECSAVRTLRATGHLSSGAWIDLIHTRTFAGIAAAQINKYILEKEFGMHVKLHAVTDLDADHPTQMRTALGDFMVTVADLLEQGEPHGTGFVPLGGYKVMTSLAYIAGSYLGFPTLYLHENSQVLHQIPAVPFTFSISVAQTLAGTIRRTVSAKTLSTLSAEDQAHIKDHHYLFDTIMDDGHAIVALNPLGLFLRKRPNIRPIIGPEIVFSAEALQAWKKNSGSQAKMKNSLVLLLSEVQKEQHHRDADTHHETSWANPKFTLPTRFNLLKHRSMVRIAWRWSKETDTLKIARIWINHDRYMRAVESCKGVDDPIDQKWHLMSSEIL